MSKSGETNIESLQRSWRKVASTHDLQTLAECTDEPRHSGGLRSKLLGWVSQQLQPVAAQHMGAYYKFAKRNHPEDDSSYFISTSITSRQALDCCRAGLLCLAASMAASFCYSAVVSNLSCWLCGHTSAACMVTWLCTYLACFNSMQIRSHAASSP
jgi:hypothetical protein